MGEGLKALQKIGEQLFSSTGKSTSSHQITWDKQNLLWACKSLAKLVKDKDSAFAKILSKYGWSCRAQRRSIR